MASEDNTMLPLPSGSGKRPERLLPDDFWMLEYKVCSAAMQQGQQTERGVVFWAVLDALPPRECLMLAGHLNIVFSDHLLNSFCLFCDPNRFLCVRNERITTGSGAFMRTGEKGHDVDILASTKQCSAPRPGR